MNTCPQFFTACFLWLKRSKTSRNPFWRLSLRMVIVFPTLPDFYTKIKSKSVFCVLEFRLIVIAFFVLSLLRAIRQHLLWILAAYVIHSFCYFWGNFWLQPGCLEGLPYGENIRNEQLFSLIFLWEILNIFLSWVIN